jgi:hypothetical protein
MSLQRLSVLALAQGCLSAAISYPSVPTLDLTRRSTPNLSRRSASANLKYNSQIDYLAQVTFGNQTFQLQIDTGSSDTWVNQDGYTCGNAPNCQFGPGYKEPGTFQPIDGVYINVTYGDKTNVIGPLGHETVKVGGITIPNAPVSIGQYISTTTGDSVTSGLMGLGYSLNTNGVNATDGTPVPYDALVPRMYSTGLIKQNLFSLALSSSGGKLAFGGLPTDVSYEKPLISAPIIPGAHYVNGSAAYTAYQINATYSYPGSSKSQTPYTILMDSGSSINSVPTAIANAVNAKFQPAVNSTDGSVPCNAVAPSFGITIGGKEFLMKKEDMIAKNADGSCMSSIGPSDSDFIMGDSFLRSVLVVYDLGKSTLSFAKLT